MSGYDPEIVDEFLDRAKQVFEGEGDGLASADIRQKVFPLVSKDGYATKAVDEALWRLEEAFADKERVERTNAEGEENYYHDVRARAQEILDRVARPSGKKFRRSSLLQPGYHQGGCGCLVRSDFAVFPARGAIVCLRGQATRFPHENWRV